MGTSINTQISSEEKGTGLICCVSLKEKTGDVRSLFTFEPRIIDFAKTDMLKI